MDAPRWFVEALDREFGGRLRIRWSRTRDAWQIEQKVARGQVELPDLVLRRLASLPEAKRMALDDKLTRARDGYVFVSEVRGGTTMPCHVCHTPLAVPVLEAREVRCPVCKAMGRDVAIVAGYWPLGEVLLDHLRKCDPLRGGAERAARDASRANEQRERTQARDLVNTNEAILKDSFTQLFEIQSVGYTGRERAWDHA